MPSEPLSCPYCNSRVPVPESREVGQRILCPRCGETFPHRTGRDDPESNGSGAPASAITAEPTAQARDTSGAFRAGVPDRLRHRPEMTVAPPPNRWSNTRVAAVILGGMAVMALLAYVYARMTRDIRRVHDRLPKLPALPVAVPFVLRLGLGVYVVAIFYSVVRGWTRRTLPVAEQAKPSWRFSVPMIAAVGVILIVLVILTSRDSQPRSGQPSDLPTVRTVAPSELDALGYLPEKTNVVAAIHVAEAMQSGTGRKRLEESWEIARSLGMGGIEQWTGLDLKDIDHVVLGWQAEKPTSPPIIVVDTRTPYDPAAVRKTLQPGRVAEHDKKPLYSFKWKKQREALLWCAGRQTLVVVLDPAQLSQIPLRPRTGAAKMPAPLRTLFQQRRLSAGTPVWLASHTGKRDDLGRWLALAPLPAEVQKVFAQVDTLRASLRLDDKMSLIVELHATDAAAAKGIEQSLRGPKLKGVKVAVFPPKDNWIVFQARGVEAAALLLLDGLKKAG